MDNAVKRHLVEMVLEDRGSKKTQPSYLDQLSESSDEISWAEAQSSTDEDLSSGRAVEEKKIKRREKFGGLYSPDCC